MAKLKGKKIKNGIIYCDDSLKLIQTKEFLRKYKGKIDLVFTSPPFPLNSQKKYGNKKGNEYIEWLSEYALALKPLLSSKGSIVIEIGNSWTPKKPTYSTVTINALLNFLEKGKYHLCQEFIWNNPAKLPTPAPWVTISRKRVSDTFTKIWWMSSTAYPRSNNKNVLRPYSEANRKLLKRQTYNHGERSSGHIISKKGFLKNNKGSIPSNVIEASNTSSLNPYINYCRKNDLKMHPARMPIEIANFFIKFLTSNRCRGYILDPFAGSNTTGAAANKLNRKWISIERDKSYIKSSLGWFK